MKAEGADVKSPSSRAQLLLLFGLWWRHMRRRATRLGDAPKVSGMPTFLLINLLSMAYMAPLAWRAVAQSMDRDPAFFAWHVLGIHLIGAGAGAAKAAGTLQLRGMRNDAFLEPLPLTTLARLGLQLVDGFFIMPLTVIVPLAGMASRGPLGISCLLPGLLGFFAYLASFVVAQAAVAWARAVGPQATARLCAYAGIGLNLCGLAVTLFPVGQVMRHGGALGAAWTRAWLGSSAAMFGIYCAVGLLLVSAYRALRAAERAGFDRVAVPGSTPTPSKGSRSRIALEWQMMWRQGGRALFLSLCVILPGFAWMTLVSVPKSVRASLLPMVAGFTVYLGAIQTIGQAGRAARSDLLARPFLAALPLSPHHVVDGKALALRKLLLPVFAMLALIGGFGVWQQEPSMAYRMLLATLSLYVVVEGAISVAFLSSGVGVVGVGGGQASSGFSTQLLMMPLLATVMAINGFTATVSFISVAAVTWEAKRAARMSVRWIDDSDDDLVRETTVWRALLAATAFFALQAMSFRLLDLFKVRAGYSLATAFGLAAMLLGLLTWRNGSRLPRPRFMPQKLWCWPLGILAGGASGLVALQMQKLLPATLEAATPSFTTGELVAVALTMVVVAPLAEEYFFRGWLQQAIERDLPEAKKRWAFALGALAFALAHVGTYGVPQLMLGLIAGALYAVGGGLWPAILAHAMHNGVVLLSASP